MLKPLTLVIKYYLKQRFLNDTWSGGIGSYTLVMMVISYLQQRRKEKRTESGNGEPNQAPEEENMASLLIGFFQFYGRQFDYIENVISVKEGGSYYDKKSRKWYNAAQPELLSVEDPHNPSVDIGSAAFNIKQAKQAFDEAYQQLVNAKQGSNAECPLPGSHNFPSFSNLSRVVYVSCFITHFRNRIQKLYGEASKENSPFASKPMNTNKNNFRNPRKNNASKQHSNRNKKFNHKGGNSHKTEVNRPYNSNSDKQHPKLEISSLDQFPSLAQKYKDDLSSNGPAHVHAVQPVIPAATTTHAPNTNTTQQTSRRPKLRGKKSSQNYAVSTS